MITTFDFNRFKSLMNYECVSESRKMLRGMLGMIIALSVCICCQLYINKDVIIEFVTGRAVYEYTWNPVSSMYHGLAMLMFLVCLGFMFVGACGIFTNMKTKQNRISFFSLPASNFEKFVARFLWMNVSFFLISILASLVADAVQALFSLIIGIGVQGSVVKTFYVMFFEEADFRVSGNVWSIWYPRIFMATLFLLAHSFWTLCGTVFRKNAWQWSAAIQIVICALFLSIVANNGSLINGVIHHVGELTVFLSLVVLFLSLAISMYFCSYKVFRRMQVVNNKWVNL